jgi:Holliday junction resolvasome RuvABC endonuclease subunit
MSKEYRMPKLISVGIDPGFSNLGISIVTREGGEYKSIGIKSIQSRKTKIERNQGMRVLEDDARRLTQIYSDLKNLITQYKPDLAGIESFAPQMGKGKGWKAVYGYAASLCVIKELDIPFFTFMAADIKKLIVGKVSSSKEDVRRVIEEKFIVDVEWPGPKSKLEHQGDATAAALLAILERDRLKKQLCM